MFPEYRRLNNDRKIVLVVSVNLHNEKVSVLDPDSVKIDPKELEYAHLSTDELLPEEINGCIHERSFYDLDRTHPTREGKVSLSTVLLIRRRHKMLTDAAQRNQEIQTKAKKRAAACNERFIRSYPTARGYARR